MKNFSRTMVIFLLIILLLHFSPFKLYPGWFKHYGGGGADRCHSIQQTPDGGYVTAGEANSYTHGGYDLGVYRLDSSGTKVWFKHYGGTNDDGCYSVDQTSGGGYVITGYTKSYSYGDTDIAVYKLDSSGNKVWFKHYGGTGDDRCYSVQQTSDGGFVMTGYTFSYSYGDNDFAIYKLDSSGNKVWFKHYGGSSDDRGYSIQQTSDGGFIIAGSTRSYSYGNADFAIYKLDSSGNKTWFKHYGGPFEDICYSLQQTSDGGYVLAGETQSYTYGNTDFAIYKLDSSGNKVWFKHYGDTNDDYAYSAQQTTDGGYVVAGSTDSYTYGYDDYAIYKLNSSGNKTWFKHYGGSMSDIARSTQQTQDGGYILAGREVSYTYGDWDIGIYKLDSDGNK